MVRYESTQQLTIETFKTPFQKGLSAGNQWVRLSKMELLIIFSTLAVGN